MTTTRPKPTTAAGLELDALPIHGFSGTPEAIERQWYELGPSWHPRCSPAQRGIRRVAEPIMILGISP